MAATAAAVLVTVPLLSGAGVVERPAPAAQRAPVTEAPEPAAAAAAARVQGSRVEVAALRSGTRAVYAEPDGTMTAELTARPVRAQRPDGSWVPVDLTLVRRPDGTVGPVAATVELSFSSGGAGAPMVRYGSDGGWIELSWPGELPVPQLSGDTATYPQVLPGVDLVLRAEPDGYAQYLVIRDRAAAQRPEVREVRLGLRSGGVELRATEDGGLAARDGDGTVVFAAAASEMWDASSPPRQAEVAVEVADGSLVLRPDRELLADPDTRFPVTVDPVFHTPDKHAWASVLSGKPEKPSWNTSGSPPWAQVGRCYEDGTCNGIGVAWTYWLFDTSFLAGKLVLAANLNATVVHSPDCSNRTHQVWKASGAIRPDIKWNNRPGGTHLGSFAAGPVRTGCPGFKTAAPSVTSAVNRGGTTTFFVKAANESDQLAWRRYDNNAKLRVHYNTVPNVPTGLATDPPVPAPCRWCAGVPYLGDGGVRLQARLSDPDHDQVRPLWHINLGGAVSQPRGTFKPSGNLHDQFVDLRSRHNQAVDWAVKAEDTAHGSAYAHGVRFVVDREPPTVAPGVTGELYQQDNRWHGGVGVPGTFRFDSAGVADIDHFRYGWTDPPATKVDADALGGKASVTLTPPGDGPRDLFVQSVDRAGHRSPMRVYHFYVRAGSGPLAQWSFEGNANDEAFLGDRHGVPQGEVAYVPGAVGQALRLDGTSTRVAAVNTVRTDASFSVSAWVKLDSAGFARAVVSQDGTNFAGFDLWYRPENGGDWVFGMARSDQSYQGTDLARSAEPAQIGVWTHLAGVYDAQQRTLQLYVNGVLSGTAERQVPDWHAGGNVQIGRTMWNGAPGVDYWPGLIDEVKLYDRVLSPAEIRTAVGADNVQAGHWKLDELAGTTGRNEAAGGEMLALHGGAAFTGDSDGDGLADGGAVGGAVQLDGVDDTATTAGPVVHTDRSFAVAGWVNLDQPPPMSGTFTALSQEGAHISGFFLGYRQLDTGGFWELYAPTADAPDRPAGEAVVRSDQPAQLGVWTHLATVYDHPAGQLRLYVNGELSGTAARTTGFDAAGPLVIGRGRNGGPSGHWPGRVDEVRAYSRELSEAEVRAVVSRDDVALGQWRLDGNSDDATGNGHHGALTGAPEWTSGQTEVPDPTDLAIRLHGGDHVSLPATLDVRQSFSVAAWAKLDQVGGTATVVSQDGSQTSAFSLLATPAGRWALAMAGSDTAGSGVSRLDGPTAQVGVWTHLVGVYDAGAGQLSLYVNGVRSGTRAHTQTWSHDTGQLQIGTGFLAGRRTNRLIGAVDDVTVYSRVLFAEQIQAMAGRDLSLAHNWRLDEGSGDQAADAVGRRAATLAGGVTRVPGRLGNAVELDGVDDRVATGGVDVRTDASFTVTAWVHLAQTCDPGDQFACMLTAVSLDGGGERTSKFRLGHTADRGQNPDGVWVFELPEPDGTVTKAAVTVLPSDFDSWVHLAGVYDESTGKLWLYVNGTRKGDGTLVEPWHATGGLQIGRGQDAAGGQAQFFPGRVDDVRLYSGGLDDARISNLYRSYPGEQDGAAELPTADAGHWTFNENTGTTVADSSGRGLTATMSGGADWTAGRKGHAGRFDGVDGYAQTAGPVLDTTRSFSVSAWAYLTRENETQVVVAQDGAAASGFVLYYNGDRGNWAAGVPVADTTTTTLVATNATEPIFPGHWTHLGLVYHAELAQLRLYVNGRLAAAQVGVDSWSADGPLTIGRGRGQGADGGYFQGVIDDVRAFGTALTDGELAKVYDDTGPVGVGHWRFDDQTLRDSSWRDNPTTADGPVSYVDGAEGMALSLAGDSAATTERWGVSEQGSLTVSAWVLLTHEPAVQTVLAQDGTRRSSFALQYRPSLDRWTFGAYTQDADEAELVYARSGAAAELNRWTHLTGVYDHAAGQLRLYVDGQLAGSRDGVTLWPSTGGLTIGRGKQDGAPAQHFTGAIDEVRIELGIVPPDQIAQRAQLP